MTSAHPKAFYQTGEWAHLRLKVRLRDKGVCQYWGCRAGTADHVTPRSCGGADIMENLVASCTPCNKLGGRPRVHEFRREEGVDSGSPLRCGALG